MNDVLTNWAALICLIGFGWGLIGLAVFAVDDIASRRKAE